MRCVLCNYETSQVIANKLRNGEDRNVYFCEKCHLGMLDSKIAEADLKEFYAQNYRKMYKPKLNQDTNPEDLFDIYSNFQDNRIALIKDFLTPDMKLLEIGCSAGMFLFHIKKYVKEVVGIDYDSKSARFASKKCSCLVFDVDIEHSGLPEQTFDIICMFQVLEHVKNPLEFLQKVERYLKPDGLLYIEVPNLNDALIYAFNLPNHHNFYFHSAHLWYFTEKSINILTGSVGFKGKIFFTQDYNILNHINWILFDAPQSSCITGLSPPSVPLRDGLKENKKEKINSFIHSVDLKYKEMLAELGITSNLSFIGRKKSKYEHYRNNAGSPFAPH